MRRRRPLLALLITSALVFVSCSKNESSPTSAAPAASAPPLVVAGENCIPAESDDNVYFSLSKATSAPINAMPHPATENDCAFYNWAWQSFLFSTQPKSDGRPAFLSFSSMEDVFGKKAARKFAGVTPQEKEDKSVLSLAPRDAKEFSQIPTLDGGFKQAGDNDAILVDQGKNPIFYAIHMNSVFADFIKANKLDQGDMLLKSPEQGGAPASLQFPSGAVEFKSAWKIVEGTTPENYFTTKARVPWLKNVDGSIVVDDSKAEGREVTVALIALHVVGVIDGHPEFIWSTFEHSGEDGIRDLAPSATANPITGTAQTIALPQKSYLLFDNSMAVSEQNRIDSAPVVDSTTQHFARATSVFRVFPGSSSESPNEDEAITSLNRNLQNLFKSRDPKSSDRRQNYRLVGAVWLNQPAGAFKENRTLRKSPMEPALLAGEDRLSSMAMESFTQKSDPNCFHCHDTTAKTLDSTKFPSIAPRQINVSHIIRMFADAAAKDAEKAAAK